jgi:hypothetical protein
VKRLALVPVLLIAVTISALPPELVMVSGRVLVAPAAVDGKVNEVAESVTAGATPAVAFIVTVCGLPVALSVMFNVALNDPAAVGAKVTWTVQDLPAASGLPPQLLVWLKLDGLAPVLPIADTLKLPEPLLVIVNDSVDVDPAAVAGKASELVDRVAAGPAAAVALNATVCGLPGALSEMLSVAEKVPAAVGVKMTLMVQLAPGAIVTPLPQLLVWVNSDAFAPVLLIRLTVRLPPPEFVTVTGSVLVEPTCMVGKTNDVVERVTAELATAVPVTVTVCGLPVALSVTFSVAENVPAAVGVKVTCALQEAPAASGLPPQLLVCVNRLALVPMAVIALMDKVPPPELVMVSGSVLAEPSVVDGKLNVVADKLAAGPMTPVPVKATVCGDPVALSVIFSVAVKAPAAAGVKVTCAVQDFPGASGLPPQLLV